MLSPVLSARSQGRVEVAAILLKALLCLTFALFCVLRRNVVIGVIACVSALLVFMYFSYQPYAKVVVNQAHVAGAAVFAWASICLILQRVRDSPAVSSLR